VDAPARSRGKSEAAKTEGTRGQDGNSQRPEGGTTQNCSSCAQARRAGESGGRSQSTGSRALAVHTAGVSVQEGCECNVLGVCGGS
jgi:hypothetical protein